MPIATNLQGVRRCHGAAAAAASLVLWKVHSIISVNDTTFSIRMIIPVFIIPSDTLAERVGNLGPDFPQFATDLELDHLSDRTSCSRY